MQQREFMKKAGIGVGTPFWTGLVPATVAASIPAGLKITGLKTFQVGSETFVKIMTNEGVTGLGEGSLYGQERSVEAAILDRESIVTGLDPTNIEFIWQAMFRWPRSRGGEVANSAISAIEIACWDIMGKVLDAPVYKLLGGAARERIRCYVQVGGRTPEAMAESVMKRKEQGFTAMRAGLAWSSDPLVRPWDLKRAVSLFGAMREGGGDDVDLIDDAHGKMTPLMSLEYMNAIEQFRPMYVEDPVQPEDMAGLKWLQDHTRVPIGIGERNYTKSGYFRDIIFNRLADYVRPDVVHAGGISECKKIGAMAESQFMDMTLHVAPSPVSQLASAHVAATTPNCVMQEISGGGPFNKPQDYLDIFYGDDIVVRDGFIQLPEKPGLGCDLDEKLAAKRPYSQGKMPHFTYEDGSVADY